MSHDPALLEAVLLTVPEAAELLRVSAGHVRRLLARGFLPRVRLGTGPRSPLRIRLVDLIDVLRGDFTEAADHAVGQLHQGQVSDRTGRNVGMRVALRRHKTHDGQSLGELLEQAGLKIEEK